MKLEDIERLIQAATPGPLKDIETAKDSLGNEWLTYGENGPMVTIDDDQFIHHMRLLAPKLFKLAKTVAWCVEQDEPVSGYIRDVLKALETES